MLLPFHSKSRRPGHLFRVAQLLGVLTAVACGGRVASDFDGGGGAPKAENDRPHSTCEAEDCAGLPCDMEEECPDGSLHYKACLPTACGKPTACHYTQATAGIGQRTLVCSCDGRVKEVYVGTGSPPVVFAYPFPQLEFCDCYEGNGEESCAHSNSCLGTPCDPTLEATPALTLIVSAGNLPWPDGAAVVAFRASDNTTVLGRGTIAGGAAEFPLMDLVSQPRFLIDENGDGACNIGEVVVSYYKEFLLLEGTVRHGLLPAQTLPCEARMPEYTPDE